jgi:23S rRNA pseudouridine2605 synthase
MRLARFIAHAGVASRREAERLIAGGRVTVAGELVCDPAREVSGSEPVAVDGEQVSPEQRVVYALHKPAGVLSTVRDTHARPTVTELIPSPARLYPVGRLDADTTGLLLLTNDGELAYRLTHPRFEVPRTYEARVGRGPVKASALEALRAGLLLDDGPTAPAEIRSLGADTIELTMHEGRKRQVRRMCAAVGHPVLELRRVRFGPLELGDLREGSHRLLSSTEVEQLRAATRDDE